MNSGGNKYDWDFGVIIGLFAAFLMFLLVFILAETKAQEPIISFAMFKKRLFATSNAASLFIGITFISATVYIPIFVQGVLGGSETNSGNILTPMMLGSVVGSQLGGFLTTRTSYRNIMIGASTFFVAGIVLLGTITPDTSRAMLVLDMVLTGFGVGFSFSVLTMAAIHPFDMRQRGAATSSNRFMISLGTTLVITAFGIIQRNLFTNKLAHSGIQGAAANGGGTNSFLTPEGRANIPHDVLDSLVQALSYSISRTFLWALIPAVLATVAIFFMSKERVTLAPKGHSKPDGYQAERRG